MKTVLYASCELGYVVQVTSGGRILEEYRAGNHRNDSQVFVPAGDPWAMSTTEICRMARSEAKRLGQLYGLPAGSIVEDADLLANFRESLNEQRTAD